MTPSGPLLGPFKKSHTQLIWVWLFSVGPFLSI